MANLIAVVGSTGQGKSTSIRTLDPNQTFVFNITKKPLPFKGAKSSYRNFLEDKEKGNFLSTSNIDNIVKVLKYIDVKRPDIKNVVIEDIQYVMAFEAMDRAKEKNFDKHVDIANNYYQVIKTAEGMRDDLNIIITSHSLDEKDSFGNIVSRRIKTLGAMLDKYITIEGLFTYVLFTDKLVEEDENGNVKSRHVFITNDETNFTTAKTPMGCFEEKYIDNDLQYVINKIEEYNN